MLSRVLEKVEILVAIGVSLSTLWEGDAQQMLPKDVPVTDQVSDLLTPPSLRRSVIHGVS